MAQCSTDELLATGRCFTQLTFGQSQAIELALLCNIWQTINPMAVCDINSLLHDARCFLCLNQSQSTALIIQLLCEINATGGSGTTCLLSGIGPPAIAVPCPFSLYREGPGPNWGLWIGDQGTGTWEAAIAQGP